jgi:hypothetical protein
VGHGRFVALAEELEAAMPGLVLAGSWRGGPSVPDCLARAASVADQVLARNVARHAFEGMDAGQLPASAKARH